MKKLFSCMLIAPLGLAIVLVLGMLFGPKGFPVTLLVWPGEIAVKAVSLVFPEVLSDATLSKVDPHSAPMGYIALVMWVGFGCWVVAGWIFCAVACFLRRKPSGSLLNADAQERRAG